MEDSESKVSRGAPGRGREDSANRAKNHTVILDSSVTGGVRARLGKEASGHRVGGLEPSAEPGDSQWEAPRVSSDLGVRKAPVAFAADSVDSPNQRESRVEVVAAAEQPVEERIPGFSTQSDVEGENAPGNGEGEFWDPLGLLARQGDPVPDQPDIYEPAAFTPDPVPEFVHVAEEPMLTEADVRAEEVYWKSCTPLVGFLVSFDYDPSGSYLELRAGRLIVSAQPDPGSNCLVLNHESVSPSHAVMRVAAGGAIQVLDQLSESGTRIRKADSGEEILLSGEKAVLSHGDVVSFGDRNFHVCLVMSNQVPG